MSKFLYGASVQGIQSFIFQTNKLQEIVGASELVEDICTDFFIKKVGKEKFKDENLILGAAGNIKYIFDNKIECEAFVRKFPKEVMEVAPGITISQAVVEYDKNGLNNALQTLEDKLREQRNKKSLPYEVGFMGTERARRTGGVGYNKRKKRKGGVELVDEATYLKRIKGDPYSEKFKKLDEQTLFRKVSSLNANKYDVKKDLLFDMDQMKRSWIAVVHADGNGLGSIIQNFNKKFKESQLEDKAVKEAFKTFSEKIEEATINAAKAAFDEIVKPKREENSPFPIRPIILGGDDLTLIIRADLALDFTTKFLKEFESQTKEEFKFLKNNYQIQGFEKGLTACAGIAYVKKSYPFHYAVDLAEKLCGDAKNFVKGKTKEYNGKSPNWNDKNKMIPKSALAFFKVQDSFIESSLSIMKDRVGNANGYNFNYGPYLIGEKENGFAHISELSDKLDFIQSFKEDLPKGESKGISKLRQWVTEVYKDKATADFFLDRMKTVNDEFYTEMEMDKERKKIDCGNKSIIYDIIQLNTLQN